MPQMFPMSMLLLSVMVTGFLVLCLVRLYWMPVDALWCYFSSREIANDSKNILYIW